MSNPPPLSAAPVDPYTWRESVLSTRSLSYLSQADLASSPHTSRRPSLAHLFHYHPPTRRSTLNSESSYLEMTPSTHLSTLPELPPSVAHSALFTLPREIRDRIWFLCLTPPSPSSVDWPPTPETPRPHLAPQLLRTCALISTEATPILYTHTPLTFAHPSDANIFARAIASPLHTGLIATLTLALRAQDTRLWMPYLTSTDSVRSLRSDFPGLRGLTVRYKSNKWQHALPVEANLRHWSEDSRLDELCHGLRQVFAGSRGMTTSEAPAIRILTLCRVHHAHYLSLTNPSPTTANPTVYPTANQGAWAGIVPPAPTERGAENAPFTGFTVRDFAGRGEPTFDERGQGLLIARTQWARRGEVEVALEVFCAEGGLGRAG